MNELTFSLGMRSAAINQEDLTKYKGYSKRYFVYVEGKTDKKFYLRILDDSVECKSVEEATAAELRVWEDRSKKATIVKSLSNLKTPPHFGIVDRDHEKNATGNGKGKGIFYTDTRDLETMLIFSDKKLYTRLGHKGIPLDDFKKAIFMSYQWGYLKQKLRLFEYPQRMKLDMGIEACFNENYQISVPAVCNHIREKNNGFIFEEEKIEFFEITDKNISNGIWNTTYQVFEYESLDVWNFINGHNLEAFLKYINQDVAIMDNFGYVLVNNYEISCFESTNLYRLLSNANLVKF